MIKEINKILKIVNNEEDYLTNNPKQLAKIMFLWYNIYSAYSLINKDEYWNISDDIEKNIDDEDFLELVYSAYVKISNHEKTFLLEDINKIFEPRELSDFELLLDKKDKSMEDFYNLLLNEKYKYNSIYPDKFSVNNHLLCVIGNGYEWNKNGFLTTDHNLNENFSNWEREVLDKRFDNIISYYSNDKIVEILKLSKKKKEDYITEKNKISKPREQVREFINTKFPTDYQKTDLEYHELMGKILNETDKEKKKSLKTVEPKKQYYPLCNYSKIDTIPNNAHKSYWFSCKEIANEILDNEKETENNKNYAKKFLKKFNIKFRLNKLENILQTENKK